MIDSGIPDHFSMVLSAVDTRETMIDRTLSIPVKGYPPTDILLGYKKIRFGAGKYAGFGGAVEAGETVLSAAIREMQEEAGLKVLHKNLHSVGRLTFLFPFKPSWNQVVHAFLATVWRGQPVESEEMVPAWFQVDKIPFDRMWEDAAYWLPRILSGDWIVATFTFNEDNETVGEMHIELWDD